MSVASPKVTISVTTEVPRPADHKKLTRGSLKFWDVKKCRLVLRYRLFSEADSSVGIATGYGLDGPGIESRWERDFPHLSRPTLGPTHPPVQWVLGLSWGTEWSGRDADLSPPSSAVVIKE
jgi:hypothetical protein